jgi:hypothetical protein
MRFLKAGVTLLAASLALLAFTAAASAHTLSKGKAQAAVERFAASVANDPDLVELGAYDSSAGECERRSAHAVSCIYLIAFDTEFGDIYCGGEAIARFKSSKSRKIRVSAPGEVICLDEDGNQLAKPTAKFAPKLKVALP